VRLGFGEVLVILLVLSALLIGIPMPGARRSWIRVGPGARVVLSVTYLILVLTLAVRTAMHGSLLGIVVAVIGTFCAIAWLRAALAANRAVKTGLRL